MNVNLLDVTAPVYLLIGLGYVAVRMSWFLPQQIVALGRYVIQFCVPAMLVRTLANVPIERAFQADFIGPYALGSLMAMGAVLGLARICLRRPMSLAAIEALGASTSNSMFIGFPVLQQLVGPPAALALALVQVVENVLMIPLGLVLADAQGGRSRRESFKLTVHALTRNPMIVGIAAGLVLSAAGLTLPGPLDKGLGMFVGAAAPTSLFVIGGSLAELKLEEMRLDVGLVAGGKLILHPLCVALALCFWHPETPEMRTAALIFAAVPMMSIYPVLGQRHHHERLCAAALLAATLGSFITVNALIAVLSKLWFP